MRRSNAVLAMLVAMLLGGCGEEPAPAPAPVPQSSVPAPPAAPKQITLSPQDYGLEIKASETDPKKYTVVWTARVPTGGWKLTTDSVLVEDSMGKTAARIWATLEQPGPDEMVTQAVETLSATHDAGTTKIDQAELSIRQHIRGVKYDTPALYGIVKRAGT